ncbi:MAG: Xylose isomerase-like TIM barrel [Lentisphaerae bacterium ADurb.Bin242]|nr:MAG: Xylose isomerase-like TIM barrel [Lentisphaerae bacterium ADurb.Bin242]
MKLCMMSCMLGDMPPREIVRAAADCGMEAVDWVALHQTDPETLKKLTEDAGLRIAAHTMIKNKFLERKPDYMNDFKQSLDDAAAMGAPILMLPPFARVNQTSLEDDRKAWIEYYAQAQPLAQKAGVTLTLESTGMKQSPIVTADEVMEVLRAVPGLQVTYDHGNVATADDPVAAYLRQKDHVVHFHLKDWKISDAPSPGGDRKRCGRYFANAMIGEGDLDLKGFWSRVDPRGRTLFVNLETLDFSGKLSKVEALKKVSDSLRNW